MSEGVPITVWINGFGSIGRCLARIVARRSSISLNGDTNWAAP
jgi:glyceraldehyde-3-phosphate dehydrogenase/erythrose-4-phosphate dehydrogenase